MLRHQKTHKNKAETKSNAGNGSVDGWMIADMGKSRATHQSCD